MKQEKYKSHGDYTNIDLYKDTGVFTDETYRELKMMVHHFFGNYTNSSDKVYGEHKEDLSHDLITHLIENMPNYDRSKGTLSTYAFKIWINYIITKKTWGNRRKRCGIEISTSINTENGEEDGEYCVLDEESYRRFQSDLNLPITKDPEILLLIVNYWKNNMETHFNPNSKMGKVVSKIIRIMSGEEEMESYTDFLKNTGVSRQLYNQILQKMRDVNSRLVRKYSSIPS